MKDLKIPRLILLSGLSSVAAYATQPPDSVASDASGNTASGTHALFNVQPAAGSGLNNSAFGLDALEFNTSGYYNVAIGAYALYKNTGGYKNTAAGALALYLNTSGSSNTAAGWEALASNTSGDSNSALGANSLALNSTGTGNASVGANALYSNISGANNTAFGYLALYSNTTGKGNAGQGTNALYNNTSGIRNLGIGSNALYENTTGSYNIALGFDAGYNVASGSNNIEIGTLGNSADNNTIQIGIQGTQTNTSIAGIFGTQVSGSAVYVTSTGQLGVQASSERFKTDITAMATLSAKLESLRPVTFRYKSDAAKVPQYGLIAEEVATVYPELVIRDAGGSIMGVHYEELAPMLLNEVQRQQRTISAQAEHAASQDAAIDALTRQVRQLTEQAEQTQDMARQLAALQATLLKRQTEDDRVAQR